MNSEANTTPPEAQQADLTYDRPESIPHVINAALSSGLMGDDNPVALFIDLTRLRAKAQVRSSQA